MTPEISKHAWERFIDRWPGPRLPKCPLRTLRDLLERSTPEDLGAASVGRMLRNHMEPVTYRVAEGWRFVLSEDGKTLITCERIIFRKPTLRKLGPRRRRRVWKK